MKVIFVDFDDTLCLHKKAVKCCNYIDKDVDPYLESIPNTCLIRYLEVFYNNGYKIILLSMASSFMLEHKKKWCKQNCSFEFLDFVSTSNDCSKKEYIEKYLESHDVKDAIFIDDSAAERSSCEVISSLEIYSPQFIHEQFYKVNTK